MPTLGLISGLLSLIGSLLYLIEVQRGKTKPERASWLIWMVVGLVALLAQKSLGATNSLWFVSMQTAGVALIFIMSLKYGTGGSNKKDKSLLLLAMIGVFLWLLTGDALLSLLLVILVRLMAVYMTVKKTLRRPRSEAALPWIFYGLAALFAVASVGQLNFSLLAYPAYVLIADVLVLAAHYSNAKTRRLAYKYVFSR